MKAYVIRRLAISVPLVFLMTFLVFAVINLNPEASIQRYVMSPTVSFQFIEQEKERLGLYDPLPIRYLRWAGGVLGNIRFGRQTRAVVSFADAGELHSTFAVHSAWTRAAPAEALPPSGDRLVLTDLWDDVATWQTMRGFVTAIEGAWTNRGGLTATLRLRVYAGGAAGSESGTDAAAWSREIEVAPGRLAAWSVQAAELGRQGIRMEDVDAIVFDRDADAAVRLESITFVAGYDVARPARHRPRARFPLFGEGHRVTFGRLGSPYTRMILPRGDWDPVGKVVAVEDVGGAPTEITETRGFRSFCLEIGNPLDVVQHAELLVTSGPPDAPLVVALPFSVAPLRRETVRFPLAEMEAHGARLDGVQELAIRSRSAGLLFVSRAFLVVDEPAVRIGWVPDFGRSYENNLPVLARLGGRVRNTILLVVASMLLTWMVALPFGVIAAVRQYRFTDKMLSFLSFVGMAVPGFFLAILVRYLAGLAADPSSWLSFLPDLPTSGRVSVGHDDLTWMARRIDVLRHATLPILVLAMGGMAGLQRVMRGTMLEVLRQPFMTTARAKGLSERAVIYKHALRNAITPFVAGFGSILPALIGGSALIEIVFNYPGVGQLMLPAVLNRDINLVMGNTLIAALLLVIGNLIADILLAVVDPRVS